MLTKPDLDQIRKLIREEVSVRISHLPTKEEFYQAMDKISQEIRDMREEWSAMSFRFRDHEQRITGLEKIHPSGLHAAA